MDQRALLPATVELTERIGWFIHLRWVAVVGVTLFVVVGPRILPLTLHLPPILTTLALLAVYNALATGYFRTLVASPAAAAPAGPGPGRGAPGGGGVPRAGLQGELARLPRALPRTPGVRCSPGGSCPARSGGWDTPPRWSVPSTS